MSENEMKLIKTLKVRVKDKHASVLRQMARDVNQVFNFCNETSSRAIRERHNWLIQGHTGGCRLCGSQRELFNPNLFSMRKH